MRHIATAAVAIILLSIGVPTPYLHAAHQISLVMPIGSDEFPGLVNFADLRDSQV
jgi:hypothetical protein